jgi:hypothetical protein
MAFLNDGTINDVLANLTALRQLQERVRVPVDPKYQDPYLPVQDAQGNAVTGELIKDPDGDVIGAAVEEPPAEGKAPGDGPVDLAKD